jgi:hypothetical protein
MKTNITHCGFLLSILVLIGNQFLYGQLVTNTNTTLTYSSIQAAIDDPLTLNGHTLSVSAGVYYENVLVNKEVSIIGPKAGIDGNDSSRGSGEAVVYPSETNFTDGIYWASGGKIFNITSDNVTIDGLTLDGDNPNLTSGYILNGADIDCETGISSHGGYAGEDPDLAGDNLVLKNNIIKNLMGYGIIMWSAASLEVSQSAQINHNKFQNILFMGIYLTQDYYATIENNTMSQLPTGINIYLFYGANTTSNPGRIKNNTIIVEPMERNDGFAVIELKGIHMIFLYNGIVNEWEVSSNSINNGSVRSYNSHGLVVSHCEGQALTIHDNTISNFENGYLLHSSVNFWTPGALPASISGGTVNNCTNGVTAVNLEEWVGSNPSDHYQLNGLTIQNSSVAGVFIASENINYDAGFETHIPTKVYVDVNNCKINNNQIGIFNEGNLGFAEVHDNDLSSNSNFAIHNLSTNTVNATCNWYGNWTGPTNAGNLGGLGDIIAGNVSFEPWLVNGTDNDSTSGFQPVPGSCIEIKCGTYSDKYIICHKGKLKCIDYLSALDHLSHGDALGECSSVEKEFFNVQLYPNPSHKSFEIFVENQSIENIEIKVFDLNGTLLIKMVSDNNKPIQLGENLKKGMYIVHVIQGENLKVLKVIKN